VVAVSFQEVVALLREIADWVICDYEAPDA